MPIKGISDSHRLPRLGKIHLGIKVEKTDPQTGKPVKNKNGEVITYPRATDYFVCPPEVREVYGDQPQRLDILIPVEDEEVWAQQYYRQYSRTRGLVCKGTGESCWRMVDRQTGAIADRNSKEVVWRQDLPCSGRECPDYQAERCQETMNLQFLLPKVPGLGVYQVDTGSINSIRNINDNAAMLRAVFERVSWLPLTLTLEPKEVVNPQDGKKKTVRVLNLRQDRGLLEVLEASKQPRALMLLPAPAEDQEPLDQDDEATEGAVGPPTPVRATDETGSNKKAAVPPFFDPEDPDLDELGEELFGAEEQSVPEKEPLPAFTSWSELAQAAALRKVYPSEVFKHSGQKRWESFVSYQDAWNVVLEILQERRERPPLI